MLFAIHERVLLSLDCLGVHVSMELWGPRRPAPLATPSTFRKDDFPVCVLVVPVPTPAGLSPSSTRGRETGCSASARRRLGRRQGAFGRWGRQARLPRARTMRIGRRTAACRDRFARHLCFFLRTRCVTDDESHGRVPCHFSLLGRPPADRVRDVGTSHVTSPHGAHNFWPTSSS